MLLNIFQSIGDFFKSIFGVFTGTLDFITLLQNNWYGLLGGAAAAGIILLLIGIFMKKFPNWLICALVIFVCIACGIGINVWITNKFGNNSNINSNFPTNQEHSLKLNTTVKENWGNTNGGFTFNQIESAKEDDSCPKANDIVINLSIQDYGDYVCFYYNDGELYQNAVFLKTENGLVYDGMLNYSATFNVYNAWWAFGWPVVEPETFKWISELAKIPYYNIQPTSISGSSFNYNNLVSISANDVDFVIEDIKNKGGWPAFTKMINWSEAVNVALSNAELLTGTNITKNFTKLNSAELIGTKENSIVQINTFYNYLWEQMKDVGTTGRKIVDVSNLLCLPIPEALQSKYPVSESFKALYPDVDYYGIYNCNIAVNCDITPGNTPIVKTANADQYLEDNIDSPTIKVETAEKGNNYSIVNIEFKNKNNSDLTTLDLSISPVKILIYNDKIGYSKTITINNSNLLEVATQILLQQETKFNYSITSSNLLFDSYEGTFNIESANSYTHIIDFDYLENKVVASVGLNAIGSIDKSQIDLELNPVTITLTKGNNSYEFIFDNSVDTTIQQVLETGEYSYTITSKQLLFASSSGKLIITPADNIILFNYAISLQSNVICTLVENSTIEANKISFGCNSWDDVNNIKALVGSSNFDIVCNIYDDYGAIEYSYKQSINNENKVLQDINLTNNKNYLLQIIVQSQDGQKAYATNFVSFTYNSNLGIEIAISCPTETSFEIVQLANSLENSSIENIYASSDIYIVPEANILISSLTGADRMQYLNVSYQLYDKTNQEMYNYSASYGAGYIDTNLPQTTNSGNWTNSPRHEVNSIYELRVYISYQLNNNYYEFYSNIIQVDVKRTSDGVPYIYITINK